MALNNNPADLGAGKTVSFDFTRRTGNYSAQLGMGAQINIMLVQEYASLTRYAAITAAGRVLGGSSDIVGVSNIAGTEMLAESGRFLQCQAREDQRIVGSYALTLSVETYIDIKTLLFGPSFSPESKVGTYPQNVTITPVAGAGSLYVYAYDIYGITATRQSWQFTGASPRTITLTGPSIVWAWTNGPGDNRISYPRYYT